MSSESPSYILLAARNQRLRDQVAELEEKLEILERMVTIHETSGYPGYWSGMEQARREYRALPTEENRS